MRYIGDPLAVTLDIGLTCRHAWEVDGKLRRLASQVDQIEPALLTDHEQLLPIRAGGRITEHQRPYRQLRRFNASFAKQ